MPSDLQFPVMPERCVCCGAPAPKNSIDGFDWDFEISSISYQPGNLSSIRCPLSKECGLAAKKLEKAPLWPSLVCSIAAGVAVYWYAEANELPGEGASWFWAFIAVLITGTVVPKLTRNYVQSGLIPAVIEFDRCVPIPACRSTLFSKACR
jgi:hypothetical protein